MHRAIAIGQHRSTVEDQRVLATDQVQIGQRRTAFARTLLQQLVALHVLVTLERRRVGHQHQFGAGPRGGRQWFCEPQVLADHQAHLDAIDLEHAVLAVRIDLEVTPLVEHRVVRQLALAIRALDAPIAQHARSVVDHRARALGPAHHGHDATHAGGDLRQRRLAGGQESRTQQQVLGRVPGQRQLREQHDLRTMRIARGSDHRFDPRGVLANGADREIELGEGDAEHGAGSVIGLRVDGQRGGGPGVHVPLETQASRP